MRVYEGAGCRCQGSLGKNWKSQKDEDQRRPCLKVSKAGPKRIKRQEQLTGSGCDIQATIDDIDLDHITTFTAAMPSYTDVPMRDRQQVPAKALNTAYPV